MTTLRHLTPLDPLYPSRLRSLAAPPASISVRGGALEAARAVAIVGSRAAHPAAAQYAGELAAELVRAGAVVVSGGAVGIDAAAHRGALVANGRTWAVAGTGHEHCFPERHAGLFETIGRGPGAMLWPFPPGYQQRGGFPARNRVLAALADAMVVVQAGLPSGALRAADCARTLMRPLWVVPAPPWLGKGFLGSLLLLEQGARPLTSTAALLASLGLAPPSSPPAGLAPAELLRPARSLSESESAVLASTSGVPLHLDEIASRAQSPASAVAVALLTLALENVVVEGPPGFFRRRDALK